VAGGWLGGHLAVAAAVGAAVLSDWRHMAIGSGRMWAGRSSRPERAAACRSGTQTTCVDGGWGCAPGFSQFDLLDSLYYSRGPLLEEQSDAPKSLERHFHCGARRSRLLSCVGRRRGAVRLRVRAGPSGVRRPADEGRYPRSCSPRSFSGALPPWLCSRAGSPPWHSSRDPAGHAGREATCGRRSRQPLGRSQAARRTWFYGADYLRRELR
jgi:hypothetical protein